MTYFTMIPVDLIKAKFAQPQLVNFSSVISYIGTFTIWLQLLSSGTVFAYIALQNFVLGLPLSRGLMNLMSALFSYALPEFLGQPVAAMALGDYFDRVLTVL